MRLFHAQKRKYYGLFAAAVGLLLFLYLFLNAKYCIFRGDESFYMAVAQRFARGDRPLVDEWQNSQLSELLLVPLYAAFKAAAGGTEGIILFTRHMFLLVCALFYGVFCRYLRPYGLWGVAAAAVFCALIPGGMLAINYYTMPPRLLMLLLFVLFFGKKECSTGGLLLTGVLLSLCVLFLPPFALLYLLFSVAVLIFEIIKKRNPARAKQYGFILSWRCWRTITLSVAVCALIFLAFLQHKSGLAQAVAAIPEILADPEHDFPGLFQSFWISKLPSLMQAFGTGNMLAALAVCVAVAVLEKRGKNQGLRFFWLCLSACLLASSYAFPILKYIFSKGEHPFYFAYVFTAVPFYAFGLTNYLLCKEKDRRLFVIWLTGVASCVVMDLFSVASVGFCAILCAVPGILCFAQVLKEYTEERAALLDAVRQSRLQKKSRTKRETRMKAIKTNAAFVSVSKTALGVTLALICVFVYAQGMFPTEGTEIRDGAYQGIVSDTANWDAYYKILADAEQLRTQSDGPVYVYSKHFNYFDTSFIFLYLEQPSANCSTWCSVNDWARQLRYFASHPEKRPDMLYFIVDDADVPRLREFIDLLCDGTVTKGVQGLIVKVNAWKDPVRPEIMDWVAQHGKEII